MKLLKRMISVFLSAVIAFGCLGGLTVSAAAAGKIGYSVDYDYYGTAFLKLTPSDSGNYLTYTTDGTAPKANSQKYSDEIAVYYKTVFRIGEFNTSGKKIAGIKLTVKPKAANVEFDVDYENGFTTVELDCPTLGAKIYYTTDGTTPTADSKLYLGEITVAKKTQIKAIAIKKDFKNSKVVSKTVSIKTNNNDSDNEEDDKSAGSLKTIRYSNSYMAEKGYTYVTLTPQKSSNVIYYTTDGSSPSKSSAKYKKRIKFTEPTVLRAVEYTAKGVKVGSIKLNVTLKCAPVEFVCSDISVGTKMIELSTATEGAKIYYTIDGSTPNPDYSLLYTGRLTLGDYTRIKAIAIKDGYKNSPVKTEIAAMIPLVIKDFDFSTPIYSEVAQEVNRVRSANGLPELKLDKKLTLAANVRAKELLVSNSHTRPSGTGAASVLTEYDISASSMTEFIATYYDNPKTLVQELLKNDKTKMIIAEDYNYNSIGVGYYEYGKSRYWAIIVAEITD